MRPVRIAIEAFELEGQPTGPGRYLHNLLTGWSRQDHNVELWLYHQNELSWPIPEDPRIQLREIGSGLIGAGWYRQQRLLSRALKKDRPDILLAPAYTAPLLWRGPAVLVVHDVSYHVHPEWFSKAHGMRMRLFTRWSCRRAAKIITVSKFARQDIARVYSIPEESIEVIYHGVDGVREEISTPSEPPYFLMLGSIFERRFPSQILDAMALLPDNSPQLIIAGADRRKGGSDLHEEIRSRGVEKRVRWEEYVAPQRRDELLRGAWALLYLSSYEGFGLPPLEAMAAGVPAIVSGYGALGEIYGDHAWLIENETPETIAHMLQSVAAERQARDAKAEAGLGLARQLTVERFAENTMEVLLSHVP